jgi:hypothetical protein
MAERETEKVVYAEGGGGGGGGGTAIIAVVAIIALLVLLYFLFGQGLLNGNSTKKINADVKIDTPVGNGA